MIIGGIRRAGDIAGKLVPAMIVLYLGRLMHGRVCDSPFFPPGDPAMGEAVRGLAGRRSAIILVDHGPVEAGEDIEAAYHALEEPYETEKLALLHRGIPAGCLPPDQTLTVVTKFDVDWNT